MLTEKQRERLESLRRKSAEYWQDEAFSEEALTDLEYRDALKELFEAIKPPRNPWNPTPPKTRR